MTDREKFELWASSPEHELPLTRFGMGDQPGQYMNADTQAAWEAWQARQPEIDELKAELDDETAIREMVAPRLGMAERADKAEAEVARLREHINKVLEQPDEDGERRARAAEDLCRAAEMFMEIAGTDDTDTASDAWRALRSAIHYVRKYAARRGEG